MRRLIYVLFLLPLLASAQEVPKYKQDQMIWFGYYNHVELNKKWSISTDAQLRTKDGYQNLSQALLRSGLVYRINERFNFTVGLAHFRYFLSNDRTRGEWRPWQEVGLNNKWRKLKITQRLRLEERFNQQVVANEISDEYNFNYRARYKLEFRWPLLEKESRGLHAVLGNEVMLNAGDVKNTFDQDRLYLGLQADLSKKFSVQLQYMHIWQLSPNAITWNNIEVLRFNLYHTISL